MRTLAHATRTLDDPRQTYDVLGNLIAAVRSLGQVLDQVASVHLDHRDLAFTDVGDSAAGAAHADQATAALRGPAAELHRKCSGCRIPALRTNRLAPRGRAEETGPDRSERATCEQA
ncbi:hypothetical protein [Cryobacterium roopkundense]|uniref:Uncharacterized protein n=1 Tax=Cryobacterium roopkundense TaxID=1001240 RepID=A0A7W9E4R1_9MICO|nr:hypothetical protein [Cryobacterium roopkundense]MBB5641709.1 hypothetical protein [Cryobacterium roopkundense]